MAFNFPDGASNGDTHTASNGVVYRFDGTVWVVDRPSTSTSFDAKYLNSTGDGIVSSSAQITDGSGIISGSTHLFTAVTSSGDISGSGTGSFGELEVETNATVDGDLKVTQYIKHKGNETTFINFTDNRIRFKAGDIGFLDMEKDGSTPYPLTVNQGGNRVNFRVVDRNTDLLLKTDSEAFNVGLYHAGNKKLETAAGGINVTGHITSSGDISGSGTGSFGVINVGGGVFTSASLAAGGVSSYTGLTNVPAGIISGSGQLPSGLISGSTQISESGFVSSSTTNVIEVMTSASYASITPVTGTLYIIQG